MKASTRYSVSVIARMPQIRRRQKKQDKATKKTARRRLKKQDAVFLVAFYFFCPGLAARQPTPDKWLVDRIAFIACEEQFRGKATLFFIFFIVVFRFI